MTEVKRTQVAESLNTAARYLRILRSLEQAHMLGNEDELVSLFGGIDPVDVQECAMEVEYLCTEVKLGVWLRRPEVWLRP